MMQQLSLFKRSLSSNSRMSTPEKGLSEIEAEILGMMKVLRYP
jgi:hypothetical protein